MTAGPHLRLRRWRARRTWLRDPRGAIERLDRAGAATRLDGESLGLRAWLALTYERDAGGAEQLARRALERGGDTRFASAALAEALMRRDDHDEAIDVLRRQSVWLAHVPWYALTLADALEGAGRVDEAVPILEDVVEHPDLRRHALKRLSRIELARGDRQRARRWFEALVALAPNYLVYASDYVTLGKLMLESGERDGALETWRCGSRFYPRHPGLRELRARHFGDAEALSEPRIAAVSEEEAGIRRFPVRTPLITLRTDLAALLDEATAGRRQPGDVIALAESPTAAAQGRVLPLELIQAGPLARVLSRFVGEIGPLHSHEGMQGAIMEAGRPRVVAGAIAGAVGRLIGRRGWFYRVAGPRTAMIDDVAACIPPLDHHLLFGPLDPEPLAVELARGLGCEVAVVDANHRTGAWVLAASPGVDTQWLGTVLRDNPAGNEDEQTPVVIVRRVAAQSAEPQPVSG